MRTISAFTLALVSSTTLFIAPSKADASLEELKARLERAQKENLILKTEKIEKENLTIKAEALEAENAAMRNEGKATKTVASNPQRFEPSASQPRIAVKQSQDNESARPRERSSTFKAVDKAIAAIPKNDERRELVAVSKAAFDPTPIKQWQGVYAGINGGYGYGSQTSTTNGYGTQQNRATYSTTEPAAAYGYGSFPYNGGFAGGQFGYNYQFTSNLMLGGEFDIDWADVNSANAGSGSGAYLQAGTSGSNFSSANGRTGLNWLGTTRVRAGYALGNFLPYLTGGLAFGELDNNALSNAAYSTSSTSYNYFSGGSASSSGSAVNIGWAAGAGAELMVAPNWSLKGEYLYTQLSGYNSYQAITTAYSQSGASYSTYNYSPSIFNTIHYSPFGVHQARVGLNYHTGWLGSSPTVVAKY